MELYGPQAEHVEDLIEQINALSPEQLAVIAEAVRRRGMNRGAWEAWAAASETSPERENQAGKAAWDVETALQLRFIGFDDATIRACSRAASDAALATATRDLIGVGKYGPWDYDKLMSAWRAGAGDPT